MLEMYGKKNATFEIHIKMIPPGMQHEGQEQKKGIQITYFFGLLSVANTKL